MTRLITFILVLLAALPVRASDFNWKPAVAFEAVRLADMKTSIDFPKSGHCTEGTLMYRNPDGTTRPGKFMLISTGISVGIAVGGWAARKFGNRNAGRVADGAGWVLTAWAAKAPIRNTILCGW